MRRRASLAGLGAAVALVSAGALGRAAPPSCTGAGAHLLAHNAYLRVYEPRPAHTGEPQSVLACATGHGGHMTLQAPARLPGLHRSLGGFELAGHVVAYTATDFGVDSGTNSLVVVDVAARRVLRNEDVGSYVDAGFIASQSVTRFVISPHGSIAWIAAQTRARRPTGIQVFAAPRQGPPVQLDSSLAIGTSSLTLSGGTLHWSDGGVVRSAPMP